MSEAHATPSVSASTEQSLNKKTGTHQFPELIDPDLGGVFRPGRIMSKTHVSLLPQDGYYGRQIYYLQSIMDDFKIILQLCGDIRWNHIIDDVS